MPAKISNKEFVEFIDCLLLDEMKNPVKITIEIPAIVEKILILLTELGNPINTKEEMAYCFLKKALTSHATEAFKKGMKDIMFKNHPAKYAQDN